MVMILGWDGKKLTDANTDVSKLPYPYAVQSLRETFPEGVKVVSRTKSRDFMDVGSFIFASSKVKAILEEHRAAVEFFPITLTYRGVDIGGWFYLHLLKAVDCLDAEKTVRAGQDDPLPGLIKYIVVRESACKGIPLFRILDSTKIGVSDELAQALRLAKCSGAVFQKPEQWRNSALYYE